MKATDFESQIIKSSLPLPIDELFNKFHYNIEQVKIIYKNGTAIQSECLFEPAHKRFIIKNNVNIELNSVTTVSRSNSSYSISRKSIVSFNDEEQAIILGY